MKNYSDWKNKYYTSEMIDLEKFFSKEQFEIIEKLGIEILKKKYTESEFEILSEKIFGFYDEENEGGSEQLLEKVGVDLKEYNEILEIISKINDEYNF